MYGTFKNDTQLSDAFPDVSKQDTARDVRELRDHFNAGVLRDFKSRREALLQLQRMVKEGEELMTQAVWKDLHKHRVEFYACEIAPLAQEIQDHLDYMEEWAKPEKVGTNIGNLPGSSYIHRDPLGVVCLIGTWNYPVNLLLSPMVSALAAGNCVVARLPGDDAARHLNNVFITLFDKYLDKKFVRYVYGGVEETKAMLRERYDLIFATGGCFLGKIVARAAAENLTPTILELGGKSPAIVDETVDIVTGARRVAWGAFTNAGQTCVRPDYVLVDERVGDKFVAELVKQILQFYGKNAKESDSFGRVVNARSFQRIMAKLNADRALVTYGGDSDEKENYIQPTIFNFKRDLNKFTSSNVMADEIFGPLLPIYYYPAGQLQWAIDYVRKGEKPLALYLFSTNAANKKKVLTETSSGSVAINDTILQLTNPELPFGGVGNSGMGAYHGRHGFDAFSHKKAVLYRYNVLEAMERFAPYTPAAEKTLRFVFSVWSRSQRRRLKFVSYAVVLAAVAFAVKTVVSK